MMTIAPGLFQKPMMEGMQPEIAETIPFPARLGSAEEIARLMQDFITDFFLNGTIIRLDGAVRLPLR